MPPPARQLVFVSGAPGAGKTTLAVPPESTTELVLATGLDYAPDWLVASADAAARGVQSAGGQ